MKRFGGLLTAAFIIIFFGHIIRDTFESDRIDKLITQSCDRLESMPIHELKEFHSSNSRDLVIVRGGVSLRNLDEVETEGNFQFEGMGSRLIFNKKACYVEIIGGTVASAKLVTPK